jgi:hypothetical protein
MSTCSQELMNTAASECPEQMDVIKVPILFDDKAVIEYTGTTDVALNTWIQNAIHAATKLTRGFPYPMAFDLEDQNEEPKFETSTIGVTRYAGEGAKGFLVHAIQDMQQLPKLAAANGLTIQALLVDQKKQVWGLKSTNGYIPVEMMATTYNGAHRTTDSAKMMTKYDYVNPEDYNNLRMLGTLTTSISNLKGLADVTLENVGTAAAPKIKLFIDGTDVTSRYATTLLVKEAWLVKGAAPASNVTYNATDIAFTTFTTVTTTGDVIRLVDPAALHALTVPVNNIEGTPITL